MTRVLVDSTVWSLGLRRSKVSDHPAVVEFSALVARGQVCLFGAIRQEVLSGIRDAARFASLRSHLGWFPTLPVTIEDHDRAAEFFNQCRAQGIQGAHTDFLICALAERHQLPILTTDGDFVGYARHLPIRLHPPVPKPRS